MSRAGPTPVPISGNEPGIRTRNPRNVPLNTSLPQDVGSVPAAINVVPEVKEDVFRQFLGELYDVTRITNEELTEIYEALRYKGFNRVEVLKQLAVVTNSTRLSTEIIIAVALQGPQRAGKTKLTNGQTPIQMGIPSSGGQGTRVLTLNKILSATADLAAFFLKKLNVPKRTMSDLPGWLQFPSAGSIKMPEHYRQLHIAFSKNFSELIGGVFNEQIYLTMQANAYLDQNLHLFD